MGTLLNRRRYMGGVSSPYDEFGYIKDGKVFHLDGISVGSTANTWTDLVGGVTFAMVNGVTYNTDHFSITSSADIFKGSSSVAIPQSSHTLEIVVNNTNTATNYRVWFHGGTSTSIVACGDRYISDAIAWTSPNKRNLITGFVNNSPNTVTIDNEKAYINGMLATYLTIQDNVNLGANVATIGSRGGGIPFKTDCDVYSIRVYNRKLTADEILNNQSVDNVRFSLGLTI